MGEGKALLRKDSMAEHPANHFVSGEIEIPFSGQFGESLACFVFLILPVL